MPRKTPEHGRQHQRTIARLAELFACLSAPGGMVDLTDAEFRKHVIDAVAIRAVVEMDCTASAEPGSPGWLDAVATRGEALQLLQRIATSPDRLPVNLAELNLIEHALEMYCDVHMPDDEDVSDRFETAYQLAIPDTETEDAYHCRVEAIMLTLRLRKTDDDLGYVTAMAALENPAIWAQTFGPLAQMRQLGKEGV